MGCSFHPVTMGDGRGLASHAAAARFNPNEPDGRYTLNMEVITLNSFVLEAAPPP